MTETLTAECSFSQSLWVVDFSREIEYVKDRDNKSNHAEDSLVSVWNMLGNSSGTLCSYTIFLGRCFPQYQDWGFQDFGCVYLASKDITIKKNCE